MIRKIIRSTLLLISAGFSFEGMRKVYTQDAYVSTCNVFPLLPLHFLYVQVNRFQDCYLIEMQFRVASQQESTREGPQRAAFSI